MKIPVDDLLKELILIADKSSRISRICRSESDGLFNMLIQEKLNDSKNPRFLHDYKTFADVLIQEMAKFCLEVKFPGLSKQIFGEESNHFENSLGQHISLQIALNQSDTFDMLVGILDQNENVAKQLIKVIYSDNKNSCDELLNQIGEFNLFVELSEIAVWIDPIDSTSEYIKGQWNQTNPNSLTTRGLHCVTCLFGVFNIKTGIPILGVMNQPFYKKLDDSSFQGRCIWGFNIDQICQNNIEQSSNREAGIILVGGKENPEFKDKLNRMTKVMYVAGAGHKLLNVAIGQADLLLTSSKSTYFWDTCAAHAILRSLGGGIIPFENFIQLDDHNLEHLEHFQIKYKQKTQDMKNIECNHSKGLIAYRTIDTLKKTINFLKVC